MQIKPLFRFVIHAVLLYAVYFVFFTFFRHYQPIEYIYNKGILFLTNGLLYATHFCLNLLGYASAVFPAEKIIQIPGSRGVLLDLGCLGRQLMGLFAGFLIAYPGKISSKLWFIPLGLVIVNILNVLRITILALVLFHYPEANITYHHDIFNIVVYAFIFLMWVFWISRYGVRSNKAKKENKSQEVAATETAS